MRKDAGVALVQVMVMSVMLLVLASMVLQVIFNGHMMVARAKTSDENKMWIEACRNQKNATWSGNPCGGGANDTCNYAADGGPTINITCGAAVTFNVTW